MMSSETPLFCCWGLATGTCHTGNLLLGMTSHSLFSICCCPLASSTAVCLSDFPEMSSGHTFKSFRDYKTGTLNFLSVQSQRTALPLGEFLLRCSNLTQGQQGKSSGAGPRAFWPWLDSDLGGVTWHHWTWCSHAKESSSLFLAKILSTVSLLSKLSSMALY